MFFKPNHWQKFCQFLMEFLREILREKSREILDDLAVLNLLFFYTSLGF